MDCKFPHVDCQSSSPNDASVAPQFTVGCHPGFSQSHFTLAKFTSPTSPDLQSIILAPPTRLQPSALASISHRSCPRLSGRPQSSHQGNLLIIKYMFSAPPPWGCKSTCQTQVKCGCATVNLNGGSRVSRAKVNILRLIYATNIMQW